MWDSMIEKLERPYMTGRKDESEGSTFCEVINSILIDQWTTTSSPLHYLAHSLNPRRLTI